MERVHTLVHMESNCGRVDVQMERGAGKCMGRWSCTVACGQVTGRRVGNGEYGSRDTSDTLMRAHART